MPTVRSRTTPLALLLLLLVFTCSFAAQAEAATDPVETLRRQIVPAAGMETYDGTPLSLSLLPEFVDWWYTLVPLVEEDPRYAEALLALLAPCCDDNTAFRCCCESEEGQACNIIRSGKGLAAHLLLDLDATAAEVRESVFQWFRFARPDYYLAAGLLERGIDPMVYGLTVEGSCYRGLCGTPISEGGCGGMEALIEPSIGLGG